MSCFLDETKDRVQRRSFTSESSGSGDFKMDDDVLWAAQDRTQTSAPLKPDWFDSFRRTGTFRAPKSRHEVKLACCESAIAQLDVTTRVASPRATLPTLKSPPQPHRARRCIALPTQCKLSTSF